jgi:hypothetical protein
MAASRHQLRTAATAVLWTKREMLPEFSEEIVDDVLDAVLPLIAAALRDEMPSTWAHHGQDGAADYIAMTFGGGS